MARFSYSSSDVLELALEIDPKLKDPQKAFVEATKILEKQVGEAISRAISGVTGAASQVVGALGSSSPIAAISGVMKGIGEAVSAIAPEAAPFIAVAEVIVDMVTTMLNFAGKAAPGVMTQLNQAWEDLQAVLGGTFVPILELLRDYVRNVADAFATLLPNMNEVREAMAPFIDTMHELWAAGKEVFDAIGPLVRFSIIKVIEGLALALKALYTPFVLLFKVISAFLHLLGLGGGSRSSVGAAARPASFHGIDDYAKSVYTAAYSTPGQPTSADMPRSVSRIDTNVEVIAKFIKRLSLGGLLDMENDPHGTSSAIAGTINNPTVAIPMASGFWLGQKIRQWLDGNG